MPFLLLVNERRAFFWGDIQLYSCNVLYWLMIWDKNVFNEKYFLNVEDWQIVCLLMFASSNTIDMCRLNMCLLIQLCICIFNTHLYALMWAYKYAYTQYVLHYNYKLFTHPGKHVWIISLQNTCILLFHLVLWGKYIKRLIIQC